MTVDQILDAFKRIDHDDVDAFLHVGGALGMVGMIEDLEASLGRPVVTVNAATYWYALRKLGVTDPMPGFGRVADERERCRITQAPILGTLWLSMATQIFLVSM